MKNLRTEKEIIKSWDKKYKEPIISINCITFNHEDYIKDALNSFLSQISEYPFEILVHDDASTDNTASIIKEYQKKYPNIIKPIYQKENKHSKGVKIFAEYLFPRSKGKYIALCEGDDYWSDDFKIHKQVNYLEKNEEIVASFHKVLRIKPNGEKTNKYFDVPYKKNQDIFDIIDIIKFKGNIIHISSLVFRKDVIKKLPNFYFECIVGDLPLTLFLSTKGNFYYFSEIMSKYREGVPNSAVKRLFSKKENFIKSRENFIKTYEKFNEYTNYRYDKEVKEVVNIYKYEIEKSKGNLAKIKKDFAEIYKNTSFIEKIKLNIKYYLPSLYNLLKKYERKINEHVKEQSN